MIIGIAFVLLWLTVSCAIGAWVGSTKGRSAMGGVLGIFGPIGWLVVVLVPARSI